MAALFLGRRKDIKKAASGPITEQVSGEQHNCCSVIGNLQNLKKLQNIFYDGSRFSSLAMILSKSNVALTTHERYALSVAKGKIISIFPPSAIVGYTTRIDWSKI